MTFPHLKTFLGAYMHQDVDVVHGTDEGAAANYVANGPPAEAMSTIGEIRVASHAFASNDAMAAFIWGAGAYYYSANGEYRAWMANIEQVMVRCTAANTNSTNFAMLSEVLTIDPADHAAIREVAEGYEHQEVCGLIGQCLVADFAQTDGKADAGRLLPTQLTSATWFTDMADALAGVRAAAGAQGMPWVESTIERAIEHNRQAIDDWLMSGAPWQLSEFFYDSPIPVAASTQPNSPQTVHPSTRIKMKLHRDDHQPRGYRVEQISPHQE